MKVLSNKGVAIDMAQYLAMNEDMVAVGNARMNARGDVVDSRGNIVKSREKIAAEYHAANPKAVKKVSLHDLSSEIVAPAVEAEQQERTVLPQLEQEFIDPATAVKQAEAAARKARAQAKRIEDNED